MYLLRRESVESSRLWAVDSSAENVFSAFVVFLFLLELEELSSNCEQQWGILVFDLCLCQLLTK